MDDKSKRNSPDSKRININEQHEVRYWTQALNITEEDLRGAVRTVGTMADDVRAYLSKRT